MLKSRKKMLLSSIAMLLVALVALGSATFAWYITQDTVHANHAKFAASTAEGLVIKHARTDANWTDSVDLNDGSSSKLTPATTNYASVIGNLVAGTGKGTSVTNGELNNAGLQFITDGIDDSTHFYVDHCYVASSAAATNAYIRVKGNTESGTYINVLIYAGNNLMGVFTSDPRKTGVATDTSKCQLVDGTDDEVETASEGQALIPLTTAGTGISTAFSAATMAAQGTEITIIAFADGYNDKCTNQDANPSVIEIALDFRTSAWT